VRLAELLDLELLRKLAESNYRASGMPIGIVDAVDGSLLVGFGWAEICTLFHRSNPVTLERCRESDEHIKRNLGTSAPCEYTCRNGLRDIGIPIRAGGEHLATLFLGQFFYQGEAPDRAFFVEQARQVGFDEAAYLAALDRVPVFDRATVANTLAYDSALATFISDLAEGALRRREAERRAEALARFPQENPDPVLRLGQDLRVTYANAAALSHLAPLGLAVGAPAPAPLVGLAQRALAGGQRVRGELSAGGRSYATSVGASGTELNVYAHDITTRVEAEAALHGTMQRLESLLENSPLAVIEWSSADFAIVRWSDEATRMFGWTAQEAVGNRIDELAWIFPEDRGSVEQVLADMRSGRRTRNVNRNRNVRKDGAVIHCEWYNSSVADPSGKLVAVLSLVLDVTERKRAEAELRAANTAKDEFLGMLSHELRNPLAPIRNALYILDRAAPGGEQARRAREVAGRQLTHLSRLVDDLLDVTRIVRGKVELRRTRLDLAALARRTGEDHRALMQERALAFDVAVLDPPVWIDGDETRLVQVIGNLLQNAAKFTPEGGRVTLSLDAGADTAELSVRDNGLGIEADLLPRLFQPFVQTKQTLARTEGGLGLGLALVKGLVELHGGAVTVESPGAGRGSRFVVRLPRMTEGRAAEGPPAAEPVRSPRVRVLVVDDNHDAAESLAEVVRMLGHDADVAFDGWSAVEKARARPPDVLLCDIGLPGLSGYQVARLLRSDRRFDGVRLVAVSGYAQPEDRQRALEAGFVEHLAKPAEPEVLGRLLTGPGR
jgi:PAS domain S-box-containing protein